MCSRLSFLAVLISVFLIGASAVFAQTVNVNTATKTELQSIKGIGEKTATRIIEERERAGAFESLEDFALRVKGLGQKRAAKLVEAGLIIAHGETSGQPKPSLLSSATLKSQVAQEVVAVKKRVQGRSSTVSAEPYWVKPK